MRFSQRYGFQPVKTVVQTESIDEDLRNGLWSVLKISYWDTAKMAGSFHPGYYLSAEANRDLECLCKRLWFNFFKKPLDTLPDDWEKVRSLLRDVFFGLVWHQVYDFIEYVGQNHPDKQRNKNFRETCNRVLEQEVSGYRFVGEQIVRIVAEEEITAVEDALKVKISPVQEHLKRALELFADRKKPDYRNSIKESISAVEALVKIVIKSEKGTLGDLLSVLEKRDELHPALKAAFIKLYGYTSDANGIRHALLEEDRVTFHEAKFMLVACSAFTNYVIASAKQ